MDNHYLNSWSFFVFFLHLAHEKFYGELESDKIIVTDFLLSIFLHLHESFQSFFIP